MSLYSQDQKSCPF